MNREPVIEKFAMIPESIITSGLPGCDSTGARTTALLVLCYLDLRQRGQRQARGTKAVQAAHQSVQGPHVQHDDPDALSATGSRSLRYEWFTSGV